MNIKKIIRNICFMGVCCLFASHAHAMGGFDVSTKPTVLEIPAGGEVILAIKIAIPKGYHIYGNPVGPGTGKPTTISVRNIPRDIEIGKTKYPEAKKHFEPGDRGYVWMYDHVVYLFLPVRAKKEAIAAQTDIDLMVDALVCGKGTCVPESKTIKQKIAILPFGSIALQLPTDMMAVYRTAKEPDEFQNGAIARQSSAEDAVHIPYSFEPRYLDASSVTNIFQAIFFGLLAGLILNFMPCVLPVVSLKVMNFIAMGGQEKRKVFAAGAFFSLGILVVFILLAFFAAFFGYGWGELFKRNEFLIAMTALVFALALSMFGVFTITASLPSAFTKSE
jgi:thiol:disulfide interchange protein DsbD